MKAKYYIRDIKTQKYYWSYRLDSGIDGEINQAKSFDTEEEALQRIEEEFQFLEDRFLEIVKVYEIE